MSIFYLNQGFPVDASLWEGINQSFEVEFFKEKYFVDVKNKIIKPLNFIANIPTTFYPILINYRKNYKKLINRKIDEFVAVEFKKDWSFFFKGVHSLKEELVLSSIKDIPAFDKVMNLFNGKKLDMGDSSYILEPLKGVYIAYIFWEGDEDFPSSLKILFDRKLADIFMQDMVWGIIVETNFRIKNYLNYSALFSFSKIFI